MADLELDLYDADHVLGLLERLKAEVEPDHVAYGHFEKRLGETIAPYMNTCFAVDDTDGDIWTAIENARGDLEYKKLTYAAAARKIGAMKFEDVKRVTDKGVMKRMALSIGTTPGRGCCLLDEWLKCKPVRPRRVGGVRFAPPGLKLAPTRSPFLNTFTGLAIPRAKAKKEGRAKGAVAKAWVKRVREIICQGDEELFDWLIKAFAYKVQNPGARWDCIPVFYSREEGTGKDRLIDELGWILGQHFMGRPSSADDVFGQFNADAWSEKFVTVLNEDSQGAAKHMAKLYNMTTSRDMTVNAKYGKKGQVAMTSDLVVLTNHEHAINVRDDSSRRFVFFHVSDEWVRDPKAKKAYFRTMCPNPEADKHGVAQMVHVARYLYEVKLDGWTPSANIPKPKAFAEQRQASLDVWGRWWVDTVRDGKHPEWWGNDVPTGELKRAFSVWCAQHGHQRLDGFSLGPRLKGVYQLVHGTPKRIRDQTTRKSSTSQTYRIGTQREVLEEIAANLRWPELLEGFDETEEDEEDED